MDDRAQMAQVQWPNGHGRLLKALSEHGNLCRACRETGQKRRTVYNWIDADPEYAKAIEQARTVGLRGFYDAAIDHLYRTIEAEEARATPESVRVAIKVVASVKPDIWGEKSSVQVGGDPEHPVVHEVRRTIVHKNA